MKDYILVLVGVVIGFLAALITDFVGMVVDGLTWTYRKVMRK